MNFIMNPLLVLDNIILFCLWMYWVAIYWVSEWVSESCLVVFDSLWPHGLSPWNSPGQNTGVGSLSLLKGIFTTQGSNPDLPHFEWNLYQLSHKGSPKLSLLSPYLLSQVLSAPANHLNLLKLTKQQPWRINNANITFALKTDYWF